MWADSSRTRGGWWAYWDDSKRSWDQSDDSGRKIQEGARMAAGGSTGTTAWDDSKLDDSGRTHAEGWDEIQALRGEAQANEREIVSLKTTVQDHEIKLDWLHVQLAEMNNLKTQVNALQAEITELQGREPARSSDAQHPSPAPAPSPSSRSSRAPSPSPSRSRCIHVGTGNVIVPKGDKRIDGHEMSVWNWTQHLQSTLFLQEGNGTWKDIEEMLYHNEEGFKVHACTTQASRYFLITCPYCNMGARGKYGINDNQKFHQEARQALSSFLLGKDADHDGEV